jgi:hypothetical protein
VLSYPELPDSCFRLFIPPRTFAKPRLVVDAVPGRGLAGEGLLPFPHGSFEESPLASRIHAFFSQLHQVALGEASARKHPRCRLGVAGGSKQAG